MQRAPLSPLQNRHTEGMISPHKTSNKAIRVLHDIFPSPNENGGITQEEVADNARKVLHVLQSEVSIDPLNLNNSLCIVQAASVSQTISFKYFFQPSLSLSPPLPPPQGKRPFLIPT
jgi:hypothetical protein